MGFFKEKNNNNDKHVLYAWLKKTCFTRWIFAFRLEDGKQRFYSEYEDNAWGMCTCSVPLSNQYQSETHFLPSHTLVQSINII